jgi:hypothetical protein
MARRAPAAKKEDERGAEDGEIAAGELADDERPDEVELLFDRE